MEGYRTFDHTGDLGLEVWAETPERLFGLAAEALNAQVVVAEPSGSDTTVELRLEGDDNEDLMVHWLNTVLLEAELEKVVWTHVSVARLTPRWIEASLAGQRLDRARHERLREVKAVSYHDLELDLTPGQCRCRVILDI